MLVADIPDTLNKNWKNDKSRFGYQMLLKMGWKEDKGLGKEETGIVNHIKLSKREQGLGLGMEKVQETVGWNHTASNFNALLQNLNEVYNNTDNDNDKTKDKKKNKKIKNKKDKIEKDKSKKRKSESKMISVGIKYKKISNSKDLSNKSVEEMTAILGIQLER